MADVKTDVKPEVKAPEAPKYDDSKWYMGPSEAHEFAIVLEYLKIHDPQAVKENRIYRTIDLAAVDKEAKLVVLGRGLAGVPKTHAWPILMNQNTLHVVVPPFDPASKASEVVEAEPIDLSDKKYWQTATTYRRGGDQMVRLEIVTAIANAANPFSVYWDDPINERNAPRLPQVIGFR